MDELDGIPMGMSRIRGLLFLAFCIALYPAFRCLVAVRHHLEMVHWYFFHEYAIAIYPHHGEPFAGYDSLPVFVTQEFTGKMHQVVEDILIWTELLMNLSPHAHTVLWIFPVSHYPLGPDYFPYARRQWLL